MEIPRTYWVLNLGAPICTLKGDIDQPGEINVKKIQLGVVQAEMYKTHADMLGKEVTVTGFLGHATTGHHHKNVMLRAMAIEAQ
jgi:hypothetical protein